jgi:RNA polymerase sigma-70 factor (ECF subfamily)
MADLSDAAIVARVLSGQTEVFGVLVTRYQDSLLAYVRHMGFDDAAAHDVVQDGFVRAFRHLGRCGDPERFDGWLFRIVSNLCRTAATKRSRRRTEALDDHAPRLEADGPDPEQQAVASAVRDRIRSALEKIPLDQREAIVLMYLHGHSVKDIAERTEASESAVKMRLKRGRDALKDELEPLFAEEGV